MPKFLKKINKKEEDKAKTRAALNKCLTQLKDIKVIDEAELDAKSKSVSNLEKEATEFELDEINGMIDKIELYLRAFENDAIHVG